MPSFPFILTGPVGRGHLRRIQIHGAADGIAPVVAGVILNLTLFFAWHTFWPQGTVGAPFTGGFDWFPVIVVIASFVALWKSKADIM